MESLLRAFNNANYVLSSTLVTDASVKHVIEKVVNSFSLKELLELIDIAINAEKPKSLEMLKNAYELRLIQNQPDVLKEATENIAKAILQYKENIVKTSLAKKGFTFETKKDFSEFCKNRITATKEANIGLTKFYLDYYNKEKCTLICVISDTQVIDLQNYTLSVTIKEQN